MRRSRSTDDEVVRSAARRVGLQLAATSALVVIIVGVFALILINHHSEPTGVVPHLEPGDDHDELVRDGLLVAGTAGVVIAGFIGWLAARNAVRPLAQALQLQRQFVANAGHELRTPLTVLHTRAQLLARRLPSHSAHRELAAQLVADSRVLGDIVDELLASAQLAHDPDRAERFGAADLVREVAISMSALSDLAGTDLRVSVDDTMMLVGSRRALRRALVALTDNAIAHTPARGVIVMSCLTREGSHVLEVRDNGHGVDPADTDRLVTRFARGANPPVASDRTADPSITAAPGSRRFGLGLSLVTEIARAHGGRYELTGAPGVGATATIYLPITPRPPRGARL